MSDHSHSSSVHASIRDQHEDINLRQKVRRLRENERKREKYIEDIKGMFAQLIQKQRRYRNKPSEGSRRIENRREEPYFQSENTFSSHHNLDYYQPLPRDHRPRHSSHPKEPKIDLPPFYRKAYVEDYLD